MMRKLPNSLYLGHASYVCSTVIKVNIVGEFHAIFFFVMLKKKILGVTGPTGPVTFRVSVEACLAV